MKLLLVEDNRPLADALKRQLGKHFVVDTAHLGREALHLAQNNSYDVAILDLGLPDTSGYDICKEIRKLGLNLPVLILSGDGETDRKVQLLEAGADDFVAKPFSTAELRARLQALLRRAPAGYAGDIVKVRDLTIDTRRRLVTRGGTLIELRRKEYDILEYLARNPGRAVSREMIFDHAWETGKDNWNNTVDVHIKHLRDKIDRPFKQPLIKTAYGIGYLLNDAP